MKIEILIAAIVILGIIDALWTARIANIDDAKKQKKQKTVFVLVNVVTLVTIFSVLIPVIRSLE